MKKTIQLTEANLKNLIRRIVKESSIPYYEKISKGLAYFIDDRKKGYKGKPEWMWKDEGLIYAVLDYYGSGGGFTPEDMKTLETYFGNDMDKILDLCHEGEEGNINENIRKTTRKVLDESFDSYALARPNSKKLIDYIEEGMVDTKTLCMNLIDWMSDDEVGRFMNSEGYADDEDDEENEEDEMYENLKRVIRKHLNEAASDEIDKHKIYDIYISIINNDRGIYDTLCYLRDSLAKHIKRGEHIDMQRLASSSVMGKIVRNIIKRYANLSDGSLHITPAERKEIKMWTASKVFQMLDDAGLLSDEEVAAYEASPYFSISEY